MVDRGAARQGLEKREEDRGLCAQLREATADLHRRVEGALCWSPFERREYVRFLAALAPLYLPIDAALLRHPGYRALVPDAASRSRSAALRADLAWLSVPLLPDPPAWPAMSRGAALGAAYVFEGATLGGRVLLRSIARTDPFLAVEASQFIRGYGPATGPMWRTFTAALDHAPLTTVERDDAIGCAGRIFEQLLDALRPKPPVTSDAPGCGP